MTTATGISGVLAGQYIGRLLSGALAGQYIDRLLGQNDFAWLPCLDALHDYISLQNRK